MLFAKYKIRVLQAIVLNYFICILTASVMIGSPAVTLDVIEKPWSIAALLIGFCFIITFNLFARTVQKFGVIAASIFQKMSLIAPTLAAILYFGESYEIMKIIGIILAIASIFVISLSDKTKSKPTQTDSAPKSSILLWAFPIGTFIGSCIIDWGLFYVNATELVSSIDIDFVASIFFFAGCIGVFMVFYDYYKNNIGYRIKDVIAAFALGIPNFFSIWFLLKVLSNGMDGSVVFPINNVGILIMTAILGLLFFNEKFNLQKTIGFIMAITAILLIAI